MKWILAILLLISASAIGQVDDTTKYISYPTQYGMKIPRMWAPTTMIMPYGDTTGKRPGKIGAFMTCTCDGNVYRWNGSNWVSFGGSAASSRFGIEDTLGVKNRYISMQTHSLTIDSGNVVINDTAKVHKHLLVETGEKIGERITMSNTSDDTYNADFNRTGTNVQCAFNFSTASVPKWFLGMDNNGTDDLLLYGWNASKYIFQVENSTGNIKFGNSLNTVINSDGTLKFGAYGSGTHTGTISKVLTVTSGGDVIESAMSDIIGATPTLQQVTQRGNKTTDTVIAGALRTPYVLPDTISQPDYEFAVFPDLQGMSSGFPDQLYSMFNWVVANKTTYNIQALLTLGDLTDDANTLQFSRVDTGFKRIDTLGIPYIGVIGNHDYDPGQVTTARNSTTFNVWFGESRYASKPWRGNAFHNKAENFYIKFDVGRTKFLVVGMEFFPTDTALLWAGRVLDSFPDRKTILLTHGYITTYGERSTDTSINGTNSYGFPLDNSGQEMWDKMIKKHKNVFMVLGGHHVDVTNEDHGYSKRFTDIGDSGNVVHQIFVNYQRAGNGTYTNITGSNNVGLGYFTRLKFSPSKGKVYLSYFSPFLNQYDPLMDSFDLDQPSLEIKTSAGIQGALFVRKEARFDSTLAISKFSKNHLVITASNGLLDTSRIYATDVATLPNNGLSRDGDSTKLGQSIGQSGNPAAFHQSREIPLNGFDLIFKNVGAGNAGNIKFYKSPNKSSLYPFIEFKDQRDTTIGQINFDSLNNTGVGKRSMQSLTTGANNTLIGALAGVAITTGSTNTLIGSLSGQLLTTGNRNVAVGASSLFRATTAFENCVFGPASLTQLTSGEDNIAFGYTTANALTTGNYNIVAGSGGNIVSALNKNSTGSRNIAIGISSSAESTVSTSNFSGTVAVGAFAMFGGSMGDKNIALGDSASIFGSRGKANVIIGANSISSGSAIVDTNIIISPYLTSSGGGFGSNNIVVGSNFHTTSTLSNVTILGAGMTNEVSNIVRLGRADQNVIMGSTGDQADNGNMLQVNGSITTITDSTNTPPNLSTIDNGKIRKTSFAGARGYKVYTALLSQTSTSDPTAIVLDNQIGSIVWTRNSTGNYTGTLTGAFTSNKTWLICQKGDGSGSFVNGLLSRSSANALTLDVRDNVNSVIDGFTNMSIEIRVYP